MYTTLTNIGTSISHVTPRGLENAVERTEKLMDEVDHLTQNLSYLIDGTGAKSITPHLIKRCLDKRNVGILFSKDGQQLNTYLKNFAVMRALNYPLNPQTPGSTAKKFINNTVFNRSVGETNNPAHQETLKNYFAFVSCLQKHLIRSGLFAAFPNEVGEIQKNLSPIKPLHEAFVKPFISMPRYQLPISQGALNTIFSVDSPFPFAQQLMGDEGNKQLGKYIEWDNAELSSEEMENTVELLTKIRLREIKTPSSSSSWARLLGRTLAKEVAIEYTFGPQMGERIRSTCDPVVQPLVSATKNILS